MLVLCYIATLLSIPDKIDLFQGEELLYKISSPFYIQPKPDKEGIISINTVQYPYDNDTNLDRTGNSAWVIKTNNYGALKLNLRLYGIIPLKTINLNILNHKELVACGNTIGVKLYFDGLLIVGMSDIPDGNGKFRCPAVDAGLKTGDEVIEVNEAVTQNIDTLIAIIDNAKSQELRVKYRRNGEINSCIITTTKSEIDGKRKLGMWVRDSTAGIGTLTFYDPDTKKFAALGHGITDIDTGNIMQIKNGELTNSTIIGVKKGIVGSAGELKGILLGGKDLGAINKNCEYGVYGTLSDEALSLLKGKRYQIGFKYQVKIGPAKMLTTIDDNGVQEYNIQIESFTDGFFSTGRNILIKITDERLLNVTGGVVQGMSGSPIIQNNRIIGAITHVLINDPARGYGIFIESMIKSEEEQS